MSVKVIYSQVMNVQNKCIPQGKAIADNSFYPSYLLLKCQKVLADCHRDKGNRENIQMDPNSCFSDLSHFMEFYRILPNSSSKGKNSNAYNRHLPVKESNFMCSY